MSGERKAVFLSYASQDAEAAKRICEALRAAGVEVWFDQSELRGGDAWDSKIRKQIRECALFVPVISRHTQERLEGYFRLEWNLAERRMQHMHEDAPFLLPVSIDETKDADAKVPVRFLDVQWMRLPNGDGTRAFCARVKNLLYGENENAGGGLPTPPRAEKMTARSGDHALHRTARMPRWVRPVLASAVLVAVVLGVTLTIRHSRESHEEKLPSKTPSAPAVSDKLSPARELVERAKAILDKGSLTREQLDAAGELCDRALQLDPTDAIVWAEAARADLLLIYPYGYDRSEERRKRAQERATRAINLDRDTFEVRLIHAGVLAHAVGTPALLAEAEKTFRQLIDSHPGDQELARQLAEVLREEKRFDEAARLFESAGELEVAGWSYYQGGQLRAALAAVKRAPRSLTALQLRAILEYSVNEDLDAAQAVIDQFQPSELLAEMPATIAMRIAMYRRDPDRVLEIAKGLSRDYLDSNAFRGPRDYFAGLANALAHRPAQAEADWRAALTLVDSRLKTAPDDRELLLWSAWLHAALKDTVTAEAIFARSQAIAGLAGDTFDQVNLRVLQQLQKKDALLTGGEQFLRTKPPGWEAGHADMRFSPEMDFLRGDPRFEKLLRDNLPPGAKPFPDHK